MGKDLDVRRLPVLLFLLLLLLLAPGMCGAEEPASSAFVLEKVDRQFGFGFFRANGYKDSIEPRVTFIKRKPTYSEAIEYSWRPMQLHDMPHKERIDRIRCTFNRYQFLGKDRRMFYGAGLGGNIILFNKQLKDWGKRYRNIGVQDGVNGLVRLFGGYKVSEFTLGKTVYPIVLRIDAFFSPPYRFGASLHKAGEELTLSEVTAGINFSIE